MAYRDGAGPRFLVTALNGWVVAMDTDTGKERWRVRLEIGSGAMRVRATEDEVVAVGAEALLILSAATGEIRTRVELHEGQRPTALLVVGRRAFVSHAGVTRCIDLDGARVVWANELPNTGFGPAGLAIPGLVDQSDAD